MLQYNFPGHWVDMEGKDQGREGPDLREQSGGSGAAAEGVGKSHQCLFPAQTPVATSGGPSTLDPPSLWRLFKSKACLYMDSGHLLCAHWAVMCAHLL